MSGAFTMLRVGRFGAAAFMTALSCIACDKLYADPVVISTTTTTPGVDSGFVTPRTPPIPCPRGGAVENSPCGRAASICEFGTSADPQCNTVFVCVSDSSYGLYWTEQTPAHDCYDQCPPENTIVDGAPCSVGDPDAGPVADDAETVCTTSKGTCACTTGPDLVHAHPRRWVCTLPGEGCPLARPLLNQLCVGDTQCDYGACKWKRGAKMTCREDVWQIEDAKCE